MHIVHNVIAIQRFSRYYVMNSKKAPSASTPRRTRGLVYGSLVTAGHL